MSVFSNGGYVPSGLDFAEWVEYLEARDEAIDYQDFLEAMGINLYQRKTQKLIKALKILSTRFSIIPPRWVAS